MCDHAHFGAVTQILGLLRKSVHISLKYCQQYITLDNRSAQRASLLLFGRHIGIAFWRRIAICARNAKILSSEH